MSKLYTIQSASTFYPLPPLNKIETGIIYIPHPLFAQFYSTYSRIVDKDYYLERYEQRYEKPANKEILDIWGNDEEMEEWAHIASIMDERLAGIVMRMFMLGESPFYLEEYIRAQRPFYSSTLKKTNKILPFPRVNIETNKYLDRGNLQLLLHITQNREYLCWDYENVIGTTLDLMPNKGKVTMGNVDPHIVSMLIDYQFDEVDDGVWEKQTVPSKTLYFNTVL